MGKGLGIHSQGTHIAFTGGTGVLVFLDLVAHLLRKVLGMLDAEEDRQIQLGRFKFILFVSFQTKEEVIGFDICRGL